jgi:hypothetical protein
LSVTSIQNEPNFPEILDKLPFKHLLEFEYTTEVTAGNPNDILALHSACPHLRTISLCQSYSHPWLDWNIFSKLKTLRLILGETMSSIPPHRLRSLEIYSSITTLALHRTEYISPLNTVEHCIQHCRFPNLRVVVLTGIPAQMIDVFQFVHCHAKLLEVNINTMTSEPIRPEAILKLIDGTGTWKSFRGKYPKSPVCHISQPDDITTDLFPPAMLTRSELTTCNSFAFARTALFPDSTLWQLPVGSPNPRYTCTALALYKLDLGTPRDIADSPESDITPKFFQLLSTYVPQLRELSFVAVQHGELGSRMSWLMVVSFSKIDHDIN